MFDAVLLTVFPVLVAYAGASDLFTMTIPNRVSILLASAFLFVGLLTGLSGQDWGMHFLGGAIVFVACFCMFAFGWMGGGDAKIASAIALWFGFTSSLLDFVLLTAIYGMFLTIGLLLFRKWPILPLFLSRLEWVSRLHDKETGIPYGIAISIAALQVYASSEWFILIG
ncbi:A24 family peptidase [Roseibium algae]|uniref:Prepilin peptidase n=1 Tax=Roseibium algae TaxID=3123038 RepID=A0ABU8TPV0_9HYPH